MKTIGDRIRERREQNELTLPQLAEKSGVAKGYLWQLENNKSEKPSAQILFKIAKALGTTVADLMGEGVRPDAASVSIPPSLADFAREAGLTQADMEMLASVNYRGRRPKTKEDWAFLWESIRRSVRRRATQALRHSRRRTQWHSLEALALSKFVGEPDPVTAMRARVDNLMARGELAGPPTDLNLLASIQDVLSIELVAMKEAGRLVPTKAGLIIQINDMDSPGRRNFTIAHELGHTLLPTYARKPVYRSEATVGNFPRNDEEEYLCDVAASALLFPDRWLRPRAEELGCTLDAVLRLADEFQGSIEATALAWTQLDLWPSAVVVWEKTLKPAEAAERSQPRLPGLDTGRPQPKFRVSKFFRSTGFPHFLPRHKSVDEGSVVSKAEILGASSGRLTTNFDKRDLTVECEARFAPYSRNGADVCRVISLLSPVR